jgi:nucleoside-diphosphate-sugar epimerase
MDFLKKELNKIIGDIDFSYLKDKKVLITGASGLVGFYLSQCLKELQKELNIKIYLSYKNSIPDYLKQYFNFQYTELKGDITTLKLKPEYFDVIIHSSGYAQPSKFLDDRIKTIKINTEATITLLNSLKKDGKFLFVSSSEVYSENNNSNITESDIGISTPEHNRACYIESKRCGETICHSYARAGYDVKIARLSLAYGPFTKKGDGRALSNLIDKGLNKEYIELLDDGSSLRTCCYITDIIEMFWNIILHGKEVTYNTGGINHVSIKELADIIGQKLNKEVKIPPIINRLVGSPKVVNISIDKYLKEFNKKSFTDINEGLSKTIEWNKTLNNE